MIEFPEHPARLPWPTDAWTADVPAADVDASALESALTVIAAMDGDQGRSLATLVVHRGVLVAEQYGEGTDQTTALISWSIAKSITQVIIGMLVGDGSVDIDSPAAVPEFQGSDKAAITLRDLLAMKSGLEFVEDYIDVSISHCLEMLFGAGQHDQAHYAASRPLAHPPGRVWSYSSGTTNIVSRLAGHAVAATAAVTYDDHESPMRQYLDQRLFSRIGMTTAVPTFDEAGTFVGSSFVHASARDFAKFGYLALRDGVWAGERLLPDGWMDYSRTVVAIAEDPPHFGYGSHWWVWRDEPGSFAAHGYEGQYIIVVPTRDLVVVQLSKVPSAVRPPLLAQLGRVIQAFPVR